jgi:hypothetical protein
MSLNYKQMKRILGIAFVISFWGFQKDVEAPPNSHS